MYADVVGDWVVDLMETCGGSAVKGVVVVAAIVGNAALIC